MKDDWRSLLEPEVLNEVTGLELIARVIVEGYLSGMHASRKTGTGLEFSQYRAYEPGDDLRLLDWKMLARSGRYYIRQSDIETNVVLKVVVDASNSMRYSENGVSKWQMARLLAAVMAYLASKQRDDIGLYTLNDKEIHSLEVREDSRQLQRFLQRLIDVETLGKWPADKEVELTHTRDKKELIVFISDFLQEKEEVVESLRQLKTGYNEVLACYLTGRKEEELDFPENAVFEDLETGRRMEVRTKTVREAYKRSLDHFRHMTSEALEELGIVLLPFYLDDNPGKVLATFIKQRNRLIR